MKRTRAKVLSVVLSLLMVFALLPATALAAAATPPDETPSVNYIFDLNYTGGGIVSQGSILIDSAFSTFKPASVTAPTGYTFAGWYLNAAGDGTAVADKDTIKDDTTYFAKWTANDVAVTFDSKGGTLITSFTGKYNGMVTKPADPIKAGYTFGGWTLHGSTPATAWNFASDKLTSAVTLDAVWNGAGPGAAQYIVDFKWNAADTTSSYQQDAVASGAKETAPTAPARTGYTFGGWYNEFGCTTAVDFSAAISMNKTFFAKWVPVVFAVTYDVNGGTPVTNATSQYNGDSPRTIGDLSSVLTNKSGFTFDAWYYDAAMTSVAKSADKITSDITLHANWLQNFSITFHRNDGTSSDILGFTSAKSGDTIASLPSSVAVGTLTGYTGSGKWYSDSALTKEFVIGAAGTGTAVTSDLNLYYKWNANSDYIVSFNSAGGSSVASINVPVTGTKTVTRPVDPTRAGYQFVKWTNGGSEFKFAGTTGATVVSGDVTLLANWAKVDAYRVTFVVDGVTYDAKDYTSGASFTVPANPTKVGYTFVGWDSNSTPSKNVLTDIYSRAVSGNMTWYAYFTQDTYTVTFSTLKGTAPASQSGFAYGATTVSAPTNPTATGYKVEGWYTALNGAGTKWVFGTTKVTGNITLYANWISTYVVTLVKGATSDSLVTDPLWTADSITADQGATLATAPVYGSGNPTPTNTNYTFEGWHKDSVNGDKWTFGAKGDTVTANVTLYAKYTKNQDTITFYPRNGEAAFSSKINYDVTTLDVNNPAAMAGYTFIGWSLDKDSSTADAGLGVVAGSSKITILTISADAGDATYYAIYTKNDGTTRNVTFRSGYDAISGDAVQNIFSRLSVANNAKIDLPAITRTGYTFAGWVADTTADGVIGAGEGTVLTGQQTITADTNYVASWTITPYTVSYDPQGGTAVASVSVNYNTAIGSAPTAPTKAGYSFVGWYKDAAGTTVWNFGSDKVTSNVTIFAKWAKVYTISFIDGNTLLKQVDVVEGAKIAAKSTNLADAPADPSKTDYDFDGWFTQVTGGSLFLDNGTASSVAVSSNLYVYAQYIAKPASQYPITFNSKGGSYVASQLVTKGDKVVAPAAPKLDNSTFKFWSLTDGGTAYDFNTAVTGVFTLYAVYAADVTVNVYDVSGSVTPVLTYKAPYNSTILVPADASDTNTKKWNGKWYSENTLTTVFNFSTPITADVNLYPGIVSKQTVTFVANNGGTNPSSQYLVSGSKISQPSVTRTGYILDGWYVVNGGIVGSKWDFNTNVVGSASLQLNAKWVYAYSVTFNLNYTGAAKIVVSSMYNRLVTKPSDPAFRAGYVFKGWYSDAACTHEWYFDTNKLLKNTELFAKWTAVVVTVVPYITDPTNKDITVVASANEGILNVTSHVFTANGSFDFIVKDAAGNVLVKKTVTIKNIDKTAPVITIAAYTTTPTNKNITVAAKTSEGTLNVASHIFTANGSFSFVAKDAAGNVTTKTVTITNIDKTAPVITIAAYTTAWSNKDITVKATFSGATTAGASHIFTVNGSYTFTAVDAAGNVATKTVTISNIDKVKPVITVKTSKGAVVTNDATITGVDLKVAFTETNLLSKTVSLNGVAIAWPSTGVFKAHGIYRFTLTDKAGNVTKFKVILK